MKPTKPTAWKSQFPRLAALIDSGIVTWDDVNAEWAGTAADGLEVSLGYDDETAERYLAHNPTPDLW